MFPLLCVCVCTVCMVYGVHCLLLSALRLCYIYVVETLSRLYVAFFGCDVCMSFCLRTCALGLKLAVPPCARVYSCARTAAAHAHAYV